MYESLKNEALLKKYDLIFIKDLHKIIISIKLEPYSKA